MKFVQNNELISSIKNISQSISTEKSGKIAKYLHFIFKNDLFEHIVIDRNVSDDYEMKYIITSKFGIQNTSLQMKHNFNFQIVLKLPKNKECYILESLRLGVDGALRNEYLSEVGECKVIDKLYHFIKDCIEKDLKTQEETFDWGVSIIENHNK